MDKKAVGERIFNIRNRLNLTLEQFGKDKNINAERSNVSKWERGATLPNRSRLEVIAKKGNMTLNELLYGNREKDIEELYEKLIKLPSKEIQKLFNRVIDFKTNENKQEEENIEKTTLWLFRANNRMGGRKKFVWKRAFDQTDA